MANSCRNANAYESTEPLSGLILVPFGNPKNNSKNLSNAGKTFPLPMTHSYNANVTPLKIQSDIFEAT
jgi:hypothetical protein